MNIKKFIYALFCIGLTMLFFTAGASAAKEKKAIHIVYDDTTGIYYGENGDYTDKWSHLKNAVQTFASLTNQGDKISIYPISGQGEAISFENNGNSAQLTSGIDSALKGHAITRSFSVVISAWEDLKSESGDYEKWLILISDGKFEEYKEEDSDNSIQEKLLSYASDGIKVVSQAISNDGAIYNLKNGENFYCYNSSGAKEILNKTIEISNLIYGRATLSDDYYEYDKRSYKFVLKDTGLPLEELILIMGDSTGSASGYFQGNATQSAAYIKNPIYAPDALKEQSGNLKIASGIEKNIFTYKFNPLLQPGEYTLSANGSENITVLYKANMAVELQLFRNGNRTDDNGSISTGKYDYKVVALNAATNQIVTSPLLDGAVYSITVCDHQNNASTLDKKEGEISFLKGNTKVETFINLGTQKFSSYEVFYVFGEVNFIVNGLEAYTVDSFDGANPFKITVRTESLPENVKLYCTSDKNVNFRIEKTSKPNEFLVYPCYAKDESYLFTATGNVDVVFTVEINENGEILTFSKPGVVVINDVAPMHRFMDWIWYYKWIFVLCAVLLILFFVFLSVYSAKKGKPSEDEKFEDTQDIKEQEENEAENSTEDMLKESENTNSFEYKDQPDEL